MGTLKLIHIYSCRINKGTAMQSEVIQYFNVPRDNLLSAITKAVLECGIGSMPDIHDTMIKQRLEKHICSVNADGVYSPMTFNNCRIEGALISVKPLRIFSAHSDEHRRYMICVSNSNKCNPVSSGPDFEHYKVCVLPQGFCSVSNAL